MKINRALSILIFAIFLMTATAATAFAADPPPERDLFGTVVSVGEDSLILDTEDGAVEVPVTDDPKIRFPRKKNATLADLVEGDRLAISLEEEDGLLIADKIALIPEKTQTRHFPGVVTALSSTDTIIESITIEPPGNGSSTTFTLSSTIIRFRNQQGTDELPPNLADINSKFVVVHPTRDPDTGAILNIALEIRVTQGKPRRKSDLIATAPRKVEPSNKAKIRGIFKGFDEEGNWIVNGTTVAFDDNTEIENALVVGRPVEIEAELRPDGTLLALEAEAKSKGRARGRVTHLNGVFNGLDEAGNWIVGGTTTVVDEDTDTDGPPKVGQRLKVKALLQKDGSLKAREIENKGKAHADGVHNQEGEIEGIFQGIDENGNWIINGAKVAVDDLTEVEGSPAIGSRVEIKTTYQDDGSLLAIEVEVEEKDKGKLHRKAKLEGVIQAIEDNGETLIVDGHKVILSPLTGLEGELQVGAFIKVEAHIQKDGSLAAREVEAEKEEEPAHEKKAKRVKIQGIVQKINEDGSVVVNGLTVVISNLTKHSGKVTEGTSIEVKGILQRNGSLLAREIKGKGSRKSISGNEVKIEGSVESTELDDAGNVIAIVIDGIEVGIREMTEVDGALETDSHVEVKGVISDGAFLASEIEVEDLEQEAEKSVDRLAAEATGTELEIEGKIEDVQRDSEGRITNIIVNGFQVQVGTQVKVEGNVKPGSEVEIKVRIDNGVLTSGKVEEKNRSEDRQKESDRPRRRENRTRNDTKDVRDESTTQIEDKVTDKDADVKDRDEKEEGKDNRGTRGRTR